MEIVVCIKQVPDVDDIKWTKENNLDRSQMLSKLNLYDEYALDWGVKFKNQFKDAHLTVISMGPKQAQDTLDYALAKGATRAILLTDKLFSGSDTIVTAKILSRAIKKYVPDFDLILCGQMAQDGDTAQVPVSIAQLLNIDDIENVVEIMNADKNQVLVSQKIDDTINIFEVSTPILLAIKAEAKESYIPRINDYIRAQGTLIEKYDAKDLDFNKVEVGVLGSPTMVYKAFRNEINKDTVEIEYDFSEKIIDLINENRKKR